MSAPQPVRFRALHAYRSSSRCGRPWALAKGQAFSVTAAEARELLNDAPGLFDIYAPLSPTDTDEGES